MRAGYGTLREVQHEWSLEDLASAHALLDAFDAAKIEAEEDA